MAIRLLLGCLAVFVCVLSGTPLVGCATTTKDTAVNPETLDVTGLWSRDPQASFDAMLANLKERGSVSDDIKPDDQTMKMMRALAGLEMKDTLLVRLDPDGTYTQTMKALPAVNQSITARWERTGPTTITVTDPGRPSTGGNLTLEIMPNGALRLDMGNIIYILKRARASQ